MKKKSGVVVSLALAGMAFLVLGATLAVAGESESHASAKAVQPAEAEGDAPVSVAGMTVFIDKETGQLRQPTAEEAAVLSAAVQRLFGGQRARTTHKQVTHKSGAIGAKLGLEHLAFSVATLGADGELAYDCASSPEAAHTRIHDHAGTPEEK